MAPNTISFDLFFSSSAEEQILIDTRFNKQACEGDDPRSQQAARAGQLLWKKLIGMSKSTKLSTIMPTKDPSVCSGSTNSLFAELERALSAIRIMDGSRSNEQWLKNFHGRVHDLPKDLVESVGKAAPKHFGARVADFNENLFYDMQERRGLSHLGLCDQRLSNLVGTHEFLGSFLTTESTLPQPAHVDYTWDVLKDQGSSLSLAFFPLTPEGMFLQVWPRNDDLTTCSKIEGDLIFIPMGKILILPASTIHGGGFRTTPQTSARGMYQQYGNLRFHLYIPTNSETLERSIGGLPVHQTNKYTEPNDKRRELCDRYVDAPHMKILQEHFFV